MSEVEVLSDKISDLKFRKSKLDAAFDFYTKHKDKFTISEIAYKYDVTTPSLRYRIDRNEGVVKQKKPKILTFREVKNEVISSQMETLNAIVNKFKPELINDMAFISRFILDSCKNKMQGEDLSTKEILDLASVVEKINNVMQIIPKMPNFAQQININQNKADKDKPIDLNVRLNFE